MSTTPTNPFWAAVQNWIAQANTYMTTWKGKGQTWRSMFWQRFQGPAPAGMIRPLQRLRMQRMGSGQMRRVAPSYGRVMPHSINQPQLFPPAYKEEYDYTYRTPMATPPYSTSKRLGVEGEKYDFTF